jgi:hypothetical protein
MRRSIPLYDETATISCTITPAEIPARIATLERMRTDHVRLERTEHGLLLHFPPSAGIEADLRQFAVDEKRCCSFWGFEVRTDDGGLALRWDGPPSAAELVEQLEAFFAGDEPADFLAALL